MPMTSAIWRVKSHVLASQTLIVTHPYMRFGLSLQGWRFPRQEQMLCIPKNLFFLGIFQKNVFLQCICTFFFINLQVWPLQQRQKGFKSMKGHSKLTKIADLNVFFSQHNPFRARFCSKTPVLFDQFSSSNLPSYCFKGIVYHFQLVYYSSQVAFDGLYRFLDYHCILPRLHENSSTWVLRVQVQLFFKIGDRVLGYVKHFF